MALTGESIRSIITVVALCYAAYSDIRTREVDDLVWVALVVVAAPFVLLEVFSLDLLTASLYIISVYTSFTVGLVTSAFGLMGEADFLALVSASLVTPPKTFGVFSLIPSLSVFVNSLLVSCLYPVLLLARNLHLIKKGVSLFENAEANPFERALALLVLTKVRKQDYMRKQNVYVIAEKSINHKRKLIFKARITESECNIPEDAEWIWVSPYIPFVAAIAAGYALHLLFGCLIDPFIAWLHNR